MYLETTEVPPTKSAQELEECLVSAGARQIQRSYNEGKLTGLEWVFIVEGNPVRFVMPVRTKKILQILRQKTRNSPKPGVLESKAEKIAWRQLFRWTQAQCAMIETGMAEPSEPFVSYAMDQNGQTLFQAFKSQQKLLAAPERPQ